MIDWPQIVFTLAVAVMASIASKEEQPYHVKICVPHDGQWTTVETWSDFVERYKYYYPGTELGSCHENKRPH